MRQSAPCLRESKLLNGMQESLPRSNWRHSEPTAAASLLIAQCVNRIQARSFHSRIDTEEQAYAAGDGNGDHHRPERNVGGKFEQFQQEAEHKGNNHTDDATSAGESHGLNNELVADIAAARANGFAHPDLA